MSDETASNQTATGAMPEPADLLSDPQFRTRFEQTSAALEAAELVREMRRQALSASGTRGISQDDLAQRVGLSQPRISQIEKGVGRDGISYALLRKIAHACGIEWGQLLRDAIAALPAAIAPAARAVAEAPAARAVAEAPAARAVAEAPAQAAAEQSIRELLDSLKAQGVAIAQAAQPAKPVFVGGDPLKRMVVRTYIGRGVWDGAGQRIGSIGAMLFDEHGLPHAVRIADSDLILGTDRLSPDSRHPMDFVLSAHGIMGESRLRVGGFFRRGYSGGYAEGIGMMEIPPRPSTSEE